MSSLADTLPWRFCRSLLPTRSLLRCCTACRRCTRRARPDLLQVALLGAARCSSCGTRARSRRASGALTAAVHGTLLHTSLNVLSSSQARLECARNYVCVDRHAASFRCRMLELTRASTLHHSIMRRARTPSSVGLAGAGVRDISVALPCRAGKTALLSAPHYRYAHSATHITGGAGMSASRCAGVCRRRASRPHLLVFRVGSAAGCRVHCLGGTPRG